MQLTVANLTYGYEDAPTLALGPINATFASGWTGVVGPNGSGKSTLLRVLTGDMGGYGGSIAPQPVVALVAAGLSYAMGAKGTDAREDVSVASSAVGSSCEDVSVASSAFGSSCEGVGVASSAVGSSTVGNSTVGNSTVGYCAQSTEHPPHNLEDFALDFTADALRVRYILGIEDDWAWRFETLSHGERKRLQVAVALWANPPVLALDEPTNHVDAAAGEQILAALAQYQGVGLLVSHDRELLDALCSQCFFMRDGLGVMRKGTYSQGREQEQQARGTVQHARKSAKRELTHLQEEAKRRASEAVRSDARRSKRKIDAKDHDAKGKIDLAIVSGKDGQAGRLSSQMNARLIAAEGRVAEAFVPKIYEGGFWLDTEPSRRRVLLAVEAGAIAVGKEGVRTISDDRANIAARDVAVDAEKSATSADHRITFPKLDVENTAHIGVVGPNGSGKSSFITHLMRHLPKDVPCFYMPQELSTAQAAQTLADLKMLDQAKRGQVLSLVARLNSDPERILSGELLSPGELRKIMLARSVLGRPQLIIMDEPTNHLDLQSTEALEAVLAECPCALVLVSHDKMFLESVTTQLWCFSADGEVSII